MAIFEVGFILDGIPLVSKEYYEEAGKKIDRTLRSGFMAAIIDFAKEAFSDELETFNLRNVKIFLMTKSIFSCDEQKRLIGYIIGDRMLDIKMARSCLENCSIKFVGMFPNVRTDVNLNIFIPFQKIFDKILGDLALKPHDRLDTVFGSKKKD